MISRIQRSKNQRPKRTGRTRRPFKQRPSFRRIARRSRSFSVAFLFFFGMTSAKAQSSASATFTGFDTVSQGNWSGKYGSDGYVIANGPQNVPGYATFARQGQQSWTWAASTTDVRALMSGSGRTATTWFSSSSFSMDINLTDGNIHQIAIYAVDFDRDGRAESFQVSDANSGALLDSRNISAFTNGTYAVWNVSGHVRVNVILTGGVNPVVSGVFFGGTSAPATASAPSTTGTATKAQFLNSNTTAEGNWKSSYGVDGYSIAGGSQKLPSYATLAAQNQSNWTWVASTSDPRALQGMNTPTTASTWYNSPSFSLDVNMTDGQSHQMALYALDWDLKGRAETIQIVDANTGLTLNSQSITNFSNGLYLVWAITGHMKVNVTLTGGPNAVISGVFFGAALNANSPSPTHAGHHHPASEPDGDRWAIRNVLRSRHRHRSSHLPVDKERRGNQRRKLLLLHDTRHSDYGQGLAIQRDSKQHRRKRHQQRGSSHRERRNVDPERQHDGCELRQGERIRQQQPDGYAHECGHRHCDDFQRQRLRRGLQRQRRIDRHGSGTRSIGQPRRDICSGSQWQRNRKRHDREQRNQRDEDDRALRHRSGACAAHGCSVVVAEHLHGERLQRLRQPGIGQRIYETYQQPGADERLFRCRASDLADSLLRGHLGELERRRELLLQRSDCNRSLDRTS